MSNVPFELNNINNMGVGYLFEKELNINDQDINKMLEDIDLQIKNLQLQDEFDNLKKDLFNSAPKEAEPDFWAMTEQWAKENNPELQNIQSHQSSVSSVESVKQEPSIKNPELQKVKDNKVEHKADENYIKNESQKLRIEKPEVHKPVAKVETPVEEKPSLNNSLSSAEKSQREADIGTVILERQISMKETHEKRINIAKNTGDLREMNRVSDRNRIEEMAFKINEKNIHAQYLSDNPMKAGVNSAPKSEIDALKKAKIDYAEKYGTENAKFTTFLSKDDVELGTPKSETHRLRSGINDNRDSKNFGRKQNTIEVTHPDLDYGVMLKKSQETPLFDIKNNEKAVNQPRDFFNNYRIPGENKNMREHMDWQKNPENPTADSNKFSSHWYNAKQSMNEAHQREMDKALLKDDEKDINLLKNKIDVEKKLFDFHEKNAMVEERKHFSQVNNNRGYGSYTNSPEKAEAFGPSMEEKQALHQAYTNHYLESKGLTIDNSNVSEGKMALHQAQTKDLMNSTYGSQDWKDKTNAHTVENFRQDYIENKVDGNYEKIMRDNLEPGKNYNIRAYNDKTKQLYSHPFNVNEVKQDMSVKNDMQQENKVNVNLNEQSQNNQIKSHNISEVNNNISSMRNKHLNNEQSQSNTVKNPSLNSENKNYSSSYRQEQSSFEDQYKKQDVSNSVEKTNQTQSNKVDINSQKQEQNKNVQSVKTENPNMKDMQNNSKLKSGIVSDHTSKTPNQNETLGNKQKTKEFSMEGAKKQEINLDKREADIKQNIQSQNPQLKKNDLGY